MGISIDKLSQLSNIPLTKGIKEESDNKSIFSQLYNSAIGVLEETNSLQKNADKLSVDFSLGKIDNVHDVMIAQEKANVALQYTVKLRDTILDAYNEIMRMQV